MMSPALIFTIFWFHFWNLVAIFTSGRRSIIDYWYFRRPITADKSFQPAGDQQMDEMMKRQAGVSSPQRQQLPSVTALMVFWCYNIVTNNERSLMHV